MKKLLAVFVLLAVVAGNACAQKSLLWKIERKGYQPAYLFGTIHIFPQEKFMISDKVKRSFDDSEMLVMELAMEPGFEMQMMQQAGMKEGVTLDDLLAPAELKKLDSALAASGMSRMIFNTWKPLLITSLFYNQYMDGGVASFELAFQKMALEVEMEIQGLETVERQMEVFESIPYADQAKDMMEMISRSDFYRALFSEMVASYQSEDIDKMLELSTREMDDLREIELFLDTRNAEWIPKMMEMMKDKRVFFAVGAGHLGGENGLIALLKKAGCKVTPVMK
jgi:hypothetical protein